MKSNPKYTLSELTNTLQTVYNIKQGRDTVRNWIKELNMKQQGPGRAQKIYTEDDIKKIVKAKQLQKSKTAEDYLIESQQQVNENILFEENQMEENYHQEIPESKKYSNSLYERIMQLKIDALFDDAGTFSKKLEFNKTELQKDLEKMDYLINYGDLNHSIYDIAEMMELDDRTRNYKNYITIVK